MDAVYSLRERPQVHGGTEGSDAGSLGSARDDAAAQAFAIGDEVVLNKRLKKKKVIGDVLLPSQLCTVTYGPDDKGDMKIERKSDGKVLRYVRPKDIEHTRAATGSPGLNGPERQGRASRGSGRFSAGSLQQTSVRRDEIGELARRFESMAEQVQSLLDSQQQLLRDVSHELRSPLARLRVGLALGSQRDLGADDPLDPKTHEDTKVSLKKCLGQSLR